MATTAKHVFLISGQRQRSMPDGSMTLAPEIEQCIVVAQDDRAAYQSLAAADPDLQPVGHATLYEYERTAAKLRAALKGDETGWRLIVASGMES